MVSVPSAFSVVVEPSGLVKLSPALSREVVTLPPGEVVVIVPVAGLNVVLLPSG